MAEKYKNPKLVKLAAEIRATHYEGIMQLLFDIAQQIQSGKMGLSKEFINKLGRAKINYLSPEHLQRPAVIA